MRHSLLYRVPWGDETPEISPRGVPSDLSWEARQENEVHVFEDGSAGDERCISKSHAAAWVANGSSKWVDGAHALVTDPDNHTHSWMTPDEFERAIGPEPIVEYGAMLATMRYFESRGYSARIVFWFDN